MMDLKKLRKENDMTQFDLAKAIGVSPNSLRGWEQGVVEPNDENKKKLEELFGVEWNDKQ